MGSDIRWKQKERTRPHHSNEAWRLGKALCMEIYRVTAGFPGDERYELRSQLRRAAVSVPSNIAETLQTFDHLSRSLQNLINALERKLAK